MSVIELIAKERTTTEKTFEVASYVVMLALGSALLYIADRHLDDRDWIRRAKVAGSAIAFLGGLGLLGTLLHLVGVWD